jgi:ABC-type antimicrobial peptide transport system permease subunit
MFKHYLITILRNVKRNKSSLFINLTGLSTAIACVLLIYLWVNDELNVDKFLVKDGQIYQVMKKNTTEHGIETDEDVPGLLAKTLKDEFPEVEKSVGVFPPADYTFNGVITINENNVKANWKFAGENFFNVFPYELMYGSKDDVLNDKNAVVISDNLAENLFKTVDNAVGKSVEWDGEMVKGQFYIAGIFKSPPENATVQFDVLFNYDLFWEKFPNFLKWNNSGPSTYVVLKKHTNIAGFNAKIAGLVKSKDSESTLTLFARPYADRYLYANYENGVQAGGRIEYVKLFSLIACIIVIIACINFMNLSTAKASRRLKEIGVKKVVGADRKTLISQHLGETLIMSFAALLIAVAVVAIFLPQFNQITGKHLAIHLDKNLIVSGIAIALFTGLLAGSYPAIYLSGLNPVALQSGRVFTKNKTSARELGLRKVLVVFQFIFSVALIVSVIVIYRQMEYVQSKNLGFDRNNVIHFAAEGRVKENPSTFISEIKKVPGVVNASFMDGDLTGRHSGSTGVTWEGKSPNQTVDFEILGVGYDLIDMLGINVLEGRQFSREFGSEESKLIFNQAAIKAMGITDPVGKIVNLWGEDRQIIGVVDNFHFESLYEDVKPFFFRFSEGRVHEILVKLAPGRERETLANLTSFYRKYQGLTFDYQFLDEDFQAMYSAEIRVSALSRYFAGLAILISCLGLFGLAAFTAEVRTKEIGIRKVMGSGVFNIVRLLSGEFTKMVLIAVVISLPLSYVILSNWLENFASHIGLQWWYFAGAGLLTLVIAWITVGVQTLKAALTNPVNCLKEE